ncbi:ANTAR domain-containing response regulator [Rubellimicrobium arenae]|uniref:ANTAR domain-containing response regulator n=1 Tax=Rubellimicrobium arenae TaxID=2817372 RepID=UPI001B304A8B|nr:ANTAR domain-containing protein [Rubellimicrobium arenae]
MRRLRVPDLGGARAVILHRPHPTVQALVRQLSAIGLQAEAHWPDLPASALGADFVFFDMDMGHDEQFPWKPGQAPMPMIALIGSEAPGRVEWALGMGADAQLLKPVGDSGVYSALLIARAGFEARRTLATEIEGLRARLAERQTVVRAVTILAAGQDDEAAYAELRRLAMSWRVTIEEAAARVVANGEAGRVRRRPS